MFFRVLEAACSSKRKSKGFNPLDHLPVITFVDFALLCHRNLKLNRIQFLVALILDGGGR